jgi:hypothetical protein
MIYKFKDKGAHYGLGYVSGELVDIDEAKGLTARCLVPVTAKDSKGVTNPTGQMVMADKDYSVDFLIESGVITPANPEDKKRYKEQLEEEKAKQKAEAEKEAEKNAAKK